MHTCLLLLWTTMYTTYIIINIFRRWTTAQLHHGNINSSAIKNSNHHFRVWKSRMIDYMFENLDASHLLWETEGLCSVVTCGQHTELPKPSRAFGSMLQSKPFIILFCEILCLVHTWSPIPSTTTSICTPRIAICFIPMGRGGLVLKWT